MTKISVAGGKPTTVVSGLRGAVISLAIDPHNLYWQDPGAGTVNSVPLTGGSPIILASGQTSQGGLAVDGETVFWTQYEGGRVMKVSTDGTALTTLANETGPTDIAVDGKSVYWVEPDAGRVMKVGREGGIPTTLIANQTDPRALAVDGTNVYWTDQTAGTIKSISLEGGDPTTVASEQGSPVAIATDGKAVYWTVSGTEDPATGDWNPDGKIMRSPVGGGAATALATAEFDPVAIVLDDHSVYWTTSKKGESNIVKLTPK